VIQDVKAVLEIYRELEPGMVDSMHNMALLHFELAELEGYKLPAAAEKMALFGAEAEIIPSLEPIKPPPWWRVWR
jgi:hypothetical protein